MATKDKTPYEILGVPEKISYEALRNVYRTKIHEHLQEKIPPINFRRICRAYETLSNFDKRKHYDSHKEWISELSLDKYTPQQLAAEPDLIRDLKQRLCNATLTEINAQDPITGHTTLYCAARAGNVEAVKFLTEHGAEPDLSQRTKSTALHVAAFYGHANAVRCLLESGADYRIVNKQGNTAEREVFNGDIRQVFAELKQNVYVRVAANELDWFHKNRLKKHQDTEYFAQRQTLLHCASKKGYFEMVRWLVEQRSANIDLVDFNGNSALHLAAYGSHTDIVDYFLNRGCDPTLKNRWGKTAEEEGSKHGKKITDRFKRMRERNMFEMARNGVDWWFYYHFGNESSDMTDYTGTSLLYYACCDGRYSVAKWLLEHGANINIQMTAKPRSTPLHGAKYRGHLSIVELLLEYGADVNIKNDYGTVFEGGVSDEVNKTILNKIDELLLQHQHNLRSEKLLDIHVYEDDADGQEPIAKIKLGFEAKNKDLLEALAGISGDQDPYFSIARRPLHFKTIDTTIISAVCCARYASSKFIDTPIRLIRHKTLPKAYKSQQPTRQEPRLDLFHLNQQLLNQGKVIPFSLEVPLTENKNITVGNLMFTFSENAINDNIHFKVTTLFSPDPQTFDLPGCTCLFKIDIRQDMSKLNELPVVSIVNEPNARLYTLATPSPYWFTSEFHRIYRLPMLNGIHAFVHHVDIIPGLLTLPPDMFIAATLGQPLQLRKKPVPCTCLFLRERDTRTFPLVAYHGTNINVVRSILLDGLVVPGTVVSNGIRVSPPNNHFPRKQTYWGIPDFAAAIFLSPSIYYSSDPTYATPFFDENRQVIPVLECSVKSGSYDTHPGTVRRYVAHPGEDMNVLEWRVRDPANIEINAVLFITKIDSIDASRMKRMATITQPDRCVIT